MSPNKHTQKPYSPQIGAAQLQLLEKLCNACAVTGDESEVRAIVLDEIKDYTDQVKVDSLGNVLVTRAGSGSGRLRVMLSAHMDEVGFMLVHDEEDGLYRFDIVGGIDVRQLPGKPVWVGRDHIPGVIGARAIHLTSQEERRRSIPVDTLRIDVGTGSTNGKVKVGDWATFATPFTRLGPSIYAKALDNRLGVATLIELVRHAPANIDLLAAFTTQEEIGLRGARVGAYTLNPDLAIVIDSTPANDLPTWDDTENTVYNTRLDGGPAIYISDVGTLSDFRLIKLLKDTAEKYKIPYQFRQPGGGGTEAGAIHRQRAGIPSVSVSVPGRYAHTAGAIARIADWQNTLALLYKALSEISPALLETH